MRLEGMFKDWMNLLPEQREQFYSTYREKRERDLLEANPLKEPKSSGFNLMASLTPEEKSLMKQLGLTPAAIAKLKNSLSKG